MSKVKLISDYIDIVSCNDNNQLQIIPYEHKDHEDID